MTRCVVEALTFAGRRLRHLRRAPGRLLGVTLNPVLFLLVFGHMFTAAIVVPGTSNYAEYLFAGAAVQVGLAGIGATAVAVATDLRGGLVDRFRSLPVTRGSVLAGHVLADWVVAVLALSVVAGVGTLVGWRTNTDLVSTVAGFGVAAAFAFVMSWVGVLLGLLLVNPESIGALTPLLVVVLPLLSNAFLGTESLPAWLRPIAEWNPLTSVITACRELWGNPTLGAGGFAGGDPITAAALGLGATLLVAAIWSMRRYRAPAFG